MKIFYKKEGIKVIVGSYNFLHFSLGIYPDSRICADSRLVSMMNVNTYPSCRILFVKYVNVDLSCKNIVGRLYPVAWNPTIEINANPHGARDYNFFQFCDIAIVAIIGKRKQPKLARHQRGQ